MNTTTMTDTREVFASLRNLTAARDSLPMDWSRFNALFGEVGDDDSLEELEERAVAATIGACTRPGMTEQQARTMGDLLAALADAEAEAAEIPDADLCALLGELVTADDLDGLALALKLVPYSPGYYVEHLRALADATDPGELNDPDRLRAEQVKALQASAKPGAVLGDELAGAVVDAMQAWGTLHAETPHQKAVREAFKAARALIDRHGEEDPRAFAAIVHAVNLQNPAFIDEKLKECGIHLPKPDRCTEDGTPLFSLEAVADALGADPEELLVKARELEGLGLGVLHTTTNTHVLQ
jgi:hypothetical protein